jgi:hypothetical protein
MKSLSVATLLCAIFLVLGVSATGEGEDEKHEKKTIKEVMKVAHKDGLLKKVLSGGAEKAEKEKLLDLYIDMFEGKPKKGEIGSWQEKAGGATLAAAKVAVGRPGALAELKKATDCGACHKAHK